MIQQICLNLPVADVPKAKAFYLSLGFSDNPQITGDTAAMIVLSPSIAVMLASHAKFREFTPKAVCDTTQAVEVLFNLRCDNRQDVDTLVAKALAAGGTTYDKPEDLGFMYSHSFLDLDGHGWGVFTLNEMASG